MTPWNKSIHLLKKVEEFYLVSTADVNSANTGLYDKIVDVANRVKDSSIRSEALLIADLYKQSLTLNNGYNYVVKSISNFVNVLLDDDSEDAEQEEVEDLMNEVNKDLRARIRSTGNTVDSPEAIKQMQEVKNSFSSGLMEDEMSEGYEGNQDLAEEMAQLGYEQDFDLSGGVSKDVGDQKGRGYRAGRVYSPKDYVEKYQNELDRYQDELSSSLNSSEKIIVSSIMGIIEKLKRNHMKMGQLQNDPGFEYDQEAKAEFENIKDSNSELMKERTKLKAKLRSYFLNKESGELKSMLQLARDPAQKFLIEQKIELSNLMSSNEFLNKGPELKIRKEFIQALDSLGAGRTLSSEVLHRYQQKINAAAALKIDAKEHYKQQAKEINIKKKTLAPEQRKETSKGNKVESKYDFENMDLEGLVIHLKQRLATERGTSKQRVADKLRAEEKTRFKPYLDGIANAQDAKDRNLLLKKVKELRDAIEIYNSVQPETIRYLKNVRNSKYFYEYKRVLDQIAKVLNSEHVMNDALKDQIRQAAFMGKSLAEQFEKSKDNKKVVEVLSKIVEKLHTILNSNGKNEEAIEQAPDTIRDPMPVAEANLYQRSLLSIAQELVNETSSTSEEFAHNIFNKLIDSIQTQEG